MGERNKEGQLLGLKDAVRSPTQSGLEEWGLQPGLQGRLWSLKPAFPGSINNAGSPIDQYSSCFRAQITNTQPLPQDGPGLLQALELLPD